MKKLQDSMKKFDEKYVKVEALSAEDKSGTYGGTKYVLKYGVPPILKYGVPDFPITSKYGVPVVAEYGVPSIKLMYGVPQNLDFE
ncbi:hypothetical protein [[Clostridium] polysaccharolyticum]|uniref:Uncharacterized protein n=1 Tax=[Clostridium] polysaccharolyticum TaxID=29364 RepID=A0A1I0DKM0_9FIRM|nr:hypothetical protein [[Clostridium] polysaccharolyticum]SET32213.1 hypothetical protein SAMN04487772_1157 [[Clostridium] polysaccharolyticum]